MEFFKQNDSAFDGKMFLKGKIVLLADDSTPLRRLLATILTKEGAKILESDNGAGVLEMLAMKKIDLVLMDIHMPVIDGLTTAKIIKNCDKYNSIPVVLISSDHAILDAVKKNRNHADGFIYKPFSRHTILTQMFDALGTH